MKPNYCSGGSFASTRISTFTNDSSFYSKSTIKKSSSRSSLGGLQAEISRNNANLTPNECGNFYSTPTTALSPFIVYRSAKYVSPHARAFQTLEIYAKHYVVLPATLIANRCKDAFYQICGLLLLLVTFPVWILMIIGLYITRRLRFLIIKRFYPSVVQLDVCDDSYLPITSESPGIVNFIIWTKGKLEGNTIRKRFKILFTENPKLQELLKLRLSTRLGANVWEVCDDFALEDHIVDAPKRFHNCPIVDEPLKELYRTGSNKSILQKYISFCASASLNGVSPPWKIHVVSYISREDGLREKACLVIRMHVAFIKNQEVNRALRELFLNSSQTPDGDKCDEVLATTDAKCRFGSWKHLQVPNWKSSDLKRFYLKIKKIGLAQQRAFTVWINLRLKQLEFHSKSAVMSLILVDAKSTLIQSLYKLEVSVLALLSKIAYHLERTLINAQALAAIPMLILATFIRRNQLTALGLQRKPISEKRHISWSDLLYGDLVQEICEKVGGLSPENVMIIACSRALRDYYQLNNMQIPLKLGFALSNATSPCSSSSLKTIHLPVNSKGRSGLGQKFKNLEEKTENYPEWKILGLMYIAKYLPLILPSYLSHKVQKRTVSCYPFSFTHVDLQPDAISACIHQLFGEVVEDFTFWQLPPLSDLGVSITLVHYTGKMRLYVMSPFPSMDTVLTHRCNQYLINIAEEVGVERSRIPYSRRTSPSSTLCSTPQLSLPFINSAKKS